MIDSVTSTSALPEILSNLIKTEKVRVKENEGFIQLWPVTDNIVTDEPKRGLLLGFLDLPPLPDSFFDPLPEEDLQAWGL